jgi:hypothetical protein
MSTTAAAAIAKRRVRRQKQIIAVGSVCLLAILGYQMPKLLGGKGNKAAAPITTAATTSPTLATGSPSPVAGRLPDTDGIALERDTSQLLSFGLFKSKDPFVQQLSAIAAPTATTPAAPKPAPARKKTAKTARKGPATTPTSTGQSGPTVLTTPATTPTSTGPTPVIPPTNTPAAPAPVTPTPAPSSPTSVLLSTNGVCEQVALNGTFPANEDIFRVVEIAKDGKSVKIAVVGGSYDSGQATATVKLGEKLTLVNTSDGSRYVIVLQAKCTVAPATAPVPSTPVTTSPALAPAPAPTPSTSAPPIVTDANDPTPPPTN